MPEKVKDTTINIRATSETKSQIDRAASLLGTDRTNFILQTVMERALEVTETHNTVTLSNRDRDAFLKSTWRAGENHVRRITGTA